MSDNDSFFARNSQVSSILGTLIMWLSLSHFSSSRETTVLEQNQAFINFLLAGCGGAFGTLLASKFQKFVKINREKRRFGDYTHIGFDDF